MDLIDVAAKWVMEPTLVSPYVLIIVLTALMVLWLMVSVRTRRLRAANEKRNDALADRIAALEKERGMEELMARASITQTLESRKDGTLEGELRRALVERYQAWLEENADRILGERFQAAAAEMVPVLVKEEAPSLKREVAKRVSAAAAQVLGEVGSGSIDSELRARCLELVSSRASTLSDAVRTELIPRIDQRIVSIMSDWIADWENGDDSASLPNQGFEALIRERAVNPSEAVRKQLDPLIDEQLIRVYTNWTEDASGDDDFTSLAADGYSSMIAARLKNPLQEIIDRIHPALDDKFVEVAEEWLDQVDIFDEADDFTGPALAAWKAIVSDRLASLPAEVRVRLDEKIAEQLESLADAELENDESSVAGQITEAMEDICREILRNLPRDARQRLEVVFADALVQKAEDMIGDGTIDGRMERVVKSCLQDWRARLREGGASTDSQPSA